MATGQGDLEDVAPGGVSDRSDVLMSDDIGNNTASYSDGYSPAPRLNVYVVYVIISWHPIH